MNDEQNRREHFYMNKTVRLGAIAYAVFAALLPLNQAVKLSDGTTINQVTGSLVIVIVGLGLLLRMKGRFIIERDLLTVFLFPAWCIVAATWSIKGFSLPVNLVISFVLLFVALLREFTDKELDMIKSVMSISASIISLYIVFFASHSYLRAVLSSETGESDPNSLALTLAFPFVLMLHEALSGKKSLSNIGGLACVGLGILFTGSRTGLLAVLIASFYLAFVKIETHKSRKITLRVFAIVLIIYVALQYVIANDILNLSLLERLTLSNVSETGGGGRIEIWSVYLKAIFNNPLRFLFGYGTGSYTSIAYSFGGISSTPHNDYIGYFATLGLIGFVLFIKLLWVFVKKARRSKSYCSTALLIVLMIGCLTIRFFEDKAAFNALIIAWQMANLVIRKEKSDKCATEDVT
jgi:hypothetical protein